MGELEYVKYCPLCGAENPRQLPFCRDCLDGNLSTVAAEPRRTAEQAAVPPPQQEGETVSTEGTATVAADGAACMLELVDNANVQFTVHEGQTVGRTEKADVVLRDVPRLDWVSGAHARFFRRGEQWYVQHIAGTNFIRVDGELYRGREEVAIYDGTILVLSLTPFRVKIQAD